MPPPIVDALDEWARGVAREGLRIVPRESLHVTLAFLGERPEEEVDAISTALVDVKAPVPGLEIGEPAWLPPRRPGVLAVDLVDGEGACGRLQTAVSAALAGLGAYVPEKRPYRPHVTVGRVRRGARVDTRVPPISVHEGFAAAALTLYRSRLSPRGARYEPLTRIPLT